MNDKSIYLEERNAFILFDKIIIVGTDEELDLFQEIIQKQDKEYRDQLAQSFNNNIKIETI